MLSALGKQPESVEDDARSFVGALVLVEMADDVKTLRKLVQSYLKALKEQNGGG